MVTGVEALEEKYMSPWTGLLGHSSGPLVDPFVHDRAPIYLTQSPWNLPSYGSSVRGVQREAWKWAGQGGWGMAKAELLHSRMLGLSSTRPVGFHTDTHTLTHAQKYI